MTSFGQSEATRRSDARAFDIGKVNGQAGRVFELPEPREMVAADLGLA